MPSRHAIERAGMLELLRQGTNDPLTILRAPAGAGKTTAVLQWLELDRLPDVSWVNAQLVPGTTREQRADTLWEALWSRPPAPGSGRRTIVIDDLARGLGHHLDERIVESAGDPNGPRWVLLTRVLGGIEARSGLHALDMTVLTPGHLRFSPDECGRFLAGSTLGGHASELHELTGGAPWLLRTALDLARRDEGRDETLLERTREAVLGAAMLRLRTGVVGAGDAWDAGLLPRLGLLPAFTARAANHLFDGRDATELLGELEEAGVVLRLGTGLGTGCREEFAFDTAIRAVLRERHAALPGPERRHGEDLAAGYAMRHGDPGTALEITVGGGNYESASQVLLRHTDSFLNGGLGGVAARWLPRVPLADMARYPVLAVALGLVYNIAGIHQVRSRELLGMAAEFRQPPGDGGEGACAATGPDGNGRNAGAYFVMEAVRAVALRVGGIGDRGRAGAVRALRIYLAMVPAERDSISGTEELLLTQTGITLHLAGLDEQAHTAAEHAVAAAHHGEHRQESGYPNTLLAYLHAVEGDMHAAAAMLDAMDPTLWEDPDTPAYLTSPYRLARAIIALEAGDWDTARSYLELMHDQLATSEFWPIMRYCAGILAVATGQATEHLAGLEPVLGREAGLPPIGAVGRVFTGVTLSWLYLAKGDPNRALEPLDAMPAGGTTSMLLRARIELARNRQQEALELIGRCQPVTPRELHNAATLRLAAELALGRGEAAREQLAAALGLSDGCGLWLGLMLLPGPDLARVKGLLRELDLEAPPVMGYTSTIPGNLATVWLTERERAILAELRFTGHAPQIAARQFVSANTVKSQLRSIYRKLGVSGRPAALREAQRHGLL